MDMTKKEEERLPKSPKGHSVCKQEHWGQGQLMRGYQGVKPFRDDCNTKRDGCGTPQSKRVLFPQCKLG
ncbi:hypothetical protein EYF80_023846 [Liparis tanakae]|uniref:Uncharacterized protein n=1 Tax=Liparis tanakae TaxID=230148 RepID=A0A4Z2HLV7_9TELE|nr:hypothetical protein EYF80_023846 [Liparis tanakae]